MAFTLKRDLTILLQSAFYGTIGLTCMIQLTAAHAAEMPIFRAANSTIRSKPQSPVQASALSGISTLSPHINAASARFDLPPALISAVIGVESGGNPGAVSPKGAMGIMQLMPGTWGEVRNWFAGFGTPLGRDPFEPKDNILAGTAYLKAQIDRYGLPNGIAAYNAGPKRVDALLNSGTPLPAETTAYVAKVRARMSGGGILKEPAPVVLASAQEKEIPSWDVFARSQANIAHRSGVVLLSN